MARQFFLPVKLPPASMLPPASDQFGRTSRFYSLIQVQKSWVVFHVNQGPYPVTLTVLQAQNISGAGAKPINASPIWLNSNAVAGGALVPQPPGASFTTDSGATDHVVIFEIMPEAAFDLVDGYFCVAAETSASNAANFTEATILTAPAVESFPPRSLFS